MALLVCCGTRMDGSGPRGVASSANCTAKDGAFKDLAAPEGRMALPAGHPISWALLTDGTVLDGSPFAYLP